ncbi:DUF4345 family protein [Agaribacterium haliotis]|uniref:DUF4345 family protein n=1 Tax=Agaribacterium haliotis TaxID=2013869 RepID=UPI000BB581E4|nr:DUF4345 family protein [Agaribacterium haliotis]
MDSIAVYRFVGVVLILVGVFLVWNPEFVSKKPVPSDPFLAVERRIWWGLIIGFGCLLLFHHQWTPWNATAAATCVSLMFGLLLARLIGIALDGSVVKQWLNVGIEVVIMLPLLWWYFHARTS